MIIFIFLVLASFVGIYLWYEKPLQQQYRADFSNLSIIALDENKKHIPINYQIYVNEALYSEGQTLKQGAVLEIVPLKSWIRITTSNIDSDKYYLVERYFYLNNSRTERINLILQKKGEVFVEHIGDFALNEPIQVDVTTDSLIKGINVCLEWSVHFIRAEINHTHNIIKIQKQPGYDYCYYLNDTINSNQQISFNISYNFFGAPDSRDYLNLFFYDTENEDIKERLNYTIPPI